MYCMIMLFFSSRRRHTILQGDWSSDVCSSDLSESGLRHSGAEGLVRLEYAEANLIQQRNRCGRLSELVERLCLDQHDQIGRASCRERKWRAVDSMGVTQIESMSTQTWRTCNK